MDPRSFGHPSDLGAHLLVAISERIAADIRSLESDPPWSVDGRDQEDQRIQQCCECQGNERGSRYEDGEIPKRATVRAPNHDHDAQGKQHGEKRSSNVQAAVVHRPIEVRSYRSRPDVPVDSEGTGLEDDHPECRPTP